MRCLNATFYALFSEGRRSGVIETLENKAAESCRIIWFDSPSRQFNFNAMRVREAAGIRLDGSIMH